jgi:hypothetical protein
VTETGIKTGEGSDGGEPGPARATADERSHCVVLSPGVNWNGVGIFAGCLSDLGFVEMNDWRIDVSPRCVSAIGIGILITGLVFSSRR